MPGVCGAEPIIAGCINLKNAPESVFMLSTSDKMWIGYLILCTVFCVTCDAQSCRPTGGVSRIHQTDERVQQDLLTCNRSAAAVSTFNEEIKKRTGVSGSYFGLTESYFNEEFGCRSTCADSEISWCIYMYHPTKEIRMCMNKHGVIHSNTTQYAWLLQLQCYFDVDPNSENIRVWYAESFLNQVLLVCTSESRICSKVTATKLEHEEIAYEKFEVSLGNDTRNHLILGRTNLFLCIAEFHNNFIESNALWYMDGEPIQAIDEDPFCDGSDCKKDELATTGNLRIRSYSKNQWRKGKCSLSVHIRHVWLWIDSANELDALRNFTCKATSPVSSLERKKTVTKTTDFMKLIPVNNCSTMDIITMEVPDLDYTAGNISAGLFLGNDNESTVVEVSKPATFQWECSVQASSGDELMWLRNGVPIPFETPSGENAPCSSMESDSVFMVKTPERLLPECQQVLQVTLVACAMSPSKWRGLYECRVNHSREDSVLVWSATVLPVMVVSTIESPSGGLPRVATMGSSSQASIEILVVLVIPFPIVLVILLVTTVCSKFRCARSSKKSFLTTHIASFTSAILGGSSTTATKTSDVGFDEDGVTPLDRIDPLEFPFDRLTVTDNILGEGRFGCVKKAIAHGIVEDDPNRNTVAIKMCRESSFHQQANLWQELQLMKKLQPHENIVNLLGYSCSPTGRLHLIIEYAMHGNLKDFLVDYHAFSQSNYSLSSPATTPEVPSCDSSRCGSSSSFPQAYSALPKKLPLSQQDSVFSSTSEDATSDLSSDSKNLPMLARGDCPCSVPGNSRSSSRSGNYSVGHNIGTASSSISQSCVDSGIGEDGNCYLELDNILNFALQIAQGLQHLKSLNVVHRDLACRNVLIAEGFLLKIADFGMAQRDQCAKDIVEVPVKWSAPEALSDHKFSHNSDIWSYGITLWEIFSYGATPYADQKIGLSFNSFIQYLIDGNRLPQPVGCPTIFYHLMKRCWQLQPDERPTATDLVENLKQMSNISYSEN